MKYLNLTVFLQENFGQSKLDIIYNNEKFYKISYHENRETTIRF